MDGNQKHVSTSLLDENPISVKNPSPSQNSESSGGNFLTEENPFSGNPLRSKDP